MKIINLIMLLVVSSTLAQVKGNKDIVLNIPTNFLFHPFVGIAQNCHLA